MSFIVHQYSLFHNNVIVLLGEWRGEKEYKYLLWRNLSISGASTVIFCNQILLKYLIESFETNTKFFSLCFQLSRLLISCTAICQRDVWKIKNTEMLNRFIEGPYMCSYGFQLTFIIKRIKILNFKRASLIKMHGYFYYVHAVMCHSVKGAKSLESSRPTHLAPALVAKAPLIKKI